MKFRFGDKVKIKEGFFKGCEGQALFYNKIDSLYLITGYVRLSEYEFKEFSTEEIEENLEKI